MKKKKIAISELDKYLVKNKQKEDDIQDISAYTLFLGETPTMFFKVNQKYALKKIRKMRERVSQTTGIELKKICIQDRYNIAPNIVELHCDDYKAIKGFEYNDFSKKSFKKFLKKLELTFQKHLVESNKNKKSDLELSKELAQMRKKVEDALKD